MKIQGRKTISKSFLEIRLKSKNPETQKPKQLFKIYDL